MHSFEFVCARILFLMTNCKLASDAMSVIGSVIGEGDAVLRRGQLRAWISNQLFAKAEPPPFLEAVAEHLRRQNFDKTHGCARGAPPSSRSAAPALPRAPFRAAPRSADCSFSSLAEPPPDQPADRGT
jgi:hypothetical protein